MEVADTAARARFAALVARPVIPIAEAALAVAEEEYPHLDAGTYVGRLDTLAAQVNRLLPQRRSQATLLRAIREVLFDEEKFRGNEESYYDPRNSFLNEVMDRKLGIPITLSIVFIEVAARVGLPVQGVAFPGHFLVKQASPAGDLFIDPFHRGELLRAEELGARHRSVTHGKDLDPRVLQPVTPRQILARLLHNLKKIYVEGNDDVRALWVIDRLLLLSPDAYDERRDRGLVSARLGGTAAAVKDLTAYLERAPAAADAGEISSLLAELKKRTSWLN